MKKEDIEKLLDIIIKINEHDVELPSLRRNTVEKLEDKMGFDEVYEKVLDYIELNDAIYDLDDFIQSIESENISVRTKTEDSLRKKWHKNLGENRPIKKVFNDIIGIRIIIKEDIDNIIEDIKDICNTKNYKIEVIDLKNKSKAKDDGYRGIHIYMDNNSKSFKVEIQIWDKFDSMLNFYTHQNIYKTDKGLEYALDLRKWIDNIPTLETYDFKDFICDLYDNPSKYRKEIFLLKTKNKDYNNFIKDILRQQFINIEHFASDDEYILLLDNWLSDIPSKANEVEMSFDKYIEIIIFEEVI